MLKIKNALLAFYQKTTGSIAFYPVLIGVLMMFLAILTLVLEQAGATSFLQKNVNVLVTYSEDNARTILSVLIGGIISLTVFSFSMVMILLNQASSYFSPRLLPGLISSKSHQYVLGTYLGTILYCLIILINIYKPDAETTLPGMAILLAILLGISCLGMFVYFIHNISTSIQASNVLYRIYQDTQKDLEELQEEERRRLEVNEDFELPETNHPIYSDRAGYLQGVSEDSLVEIAQEKDFVVNLEVSRGMFVLKNIPIATCSKELDGKTADQVLSCFQFSNQEIVRQNYVLGFKHITEVAVKAMSPGINDPGTALTAIDYLSALLDMRLTVSDREFAKDEAGERRLFYKTITFEKLAYNILASLRQYCKHDVVIVQKMLTMLHYLHSQKGVAMVYKDVLKTEMETLLEDARENIANRHDLAMVEGMAERFGV